MGFPSLRFLFAALAGAAAALLSAGAVRADSLAAAGQLGIRFQGMDDADLESGLARHMLFLRRAHRQSGLALVGATSHSRLAAFGSDTLTYVTPAYRAAARQTCESLMAEEGLLSCEPNYIYSLTGVPNDSYYSELWGMAKIGAPSAWDISSGSQSVTVAVIDTGVEYTHPDLSANSWLNAADSAGNGVDDDNNG